MARIVINPKVFEDSRDAKCVAYNEALRIVMEEMGYDPVAEPTEAQRKFFSTTAYRNDENALRRTILARICVFDDSVKNPTDEQLQEAVEFLEDVMRAGVPQTPEEQSILQRAHDVIVRIAGGPAARQARGAGGPPPQEGPTAGREPPPTASAAGEEGLSEPPPAPPTEGPSPQGLPPEAP